MIGGSFFCSPDGIRTRATALRGRRPRPLDDGARTRFTHVLFFALQEQPCGLFCGSSASLACLSPAAKSTGFSLGYQDSNLEWRYQKPLCCQLHHTPMNFFTVLLGLARSASLLCSAARLRPKRRLPVPLPQTPNRMVRATFSPFFGRRPPKLSGYRCPTGTQTGDRHVTTEQFHRLVERRADVRAGDRHPHRRKRLTRFEL